MPPSSGDQHTLTVATLGAHLVELLEVGHAHITLGDLSVEAVNACSGDVFNIDPEMTDWFSSDASIAAVTPEKVQGENVGTATAFAEGTIEVWGGVCGCFWESVKPSAPVTVKPQIVSISPNWGQTGN